MRSALGLLAALIALPLLAVSCADDERTTLTVFAAASLTDAFREIAQAFEAAHPNAEVRLSFGGSQRLRLQIEQGAPVDVFAAAGARFVDRLAIANLIYPETRRVFCIGDLVAWVNNDSQLPLTSLDDLAAPHIRRIAIANPHHAPYGELARQALVNAGLWDAVQPKLVQGQNVRQALQYAEAGDVDVSFVPLPLAVIAGGRWLAVPDSLYEPMQQTVAAIRRTGSRNAAPAAQFVDFLMSSQVQTMLQRHGFRTVATGEMAL